MARVTELGGVQFTEEVLEGFTPIEALDTKLNSAFGQDQLKSLRDLKSGMASIAIEKGGNCICHFKYGQRTGGVLQQLWSVDNMMWYGSGVIGRVD